MDERLKKLMQELGNAINESLSDSDKIAEAIRNIKKAGYDVFLVLEVTIGFNKIEDSQEEAPPKARVGQNGEVQFDPGDDKFLKSLHILPDKK